MVIDGPPTKLQPETSPICRQPGYGLRLLIAFMALTGLLAVYPTRFSHRWDREHGKVPLFQTVNTEYKRLDEYRKA
jgi:hypothetical protein